MSYIPDEMQIGEPLYISQPPTNPMSSDAMKYLVDIGRRSRDYVVQEINGDIYANTDCLQRIKKHERPAPDVFTARTLSGLVDWLRADLDHLYDEYGTLYVSVSDVNRVNVLSPLYGENNERCTLAYCEVNMPSIRLNDYMDSESFVVMMQTHFCEGDNRDGVLAIAGNLRMEQSAQTADDGMSQRVTLKQGIATVGETTVKNPVHLAPRRTFHEIEQPSSPFILRFRKEEGSPQEVALFEADGGAWKINAIALIGEWLKAQLPGLDVVVIA